MQTEDKFGRSEKRWFLWTLVFSPCQSEQVLFGHLAYRKRLVLLCYYDRAILRFITMCFILEISSNKKRNFFFELIHLYFVSLPRQTSKPFWVGMGDRHIGKVELDVILAANLNFANSKHHPHGNAMTDVHGYDIHSIPIVFHYSVGFDIAYPRMMGNAKA